MQHSQEPACNLPALGGELMQAESKLYHAHDLKSGINADSHAMRAGLRHQAESRINDSASSILQNDKGILNAGGMCGAGANAKTGQVFPFTSHPTQPCYQ